MHRNAMIGLVMLAAAAFAGAACAADPTMHQVYQAAEGGRMAEAQAMMGQVLRDHPNSAKAHYVEAELMVRQGRLADARTQLATAEHLAPGLPFAKPQSVQALTARLSGAYAGAPLAARPLRPAPAHPFPWGLVLLFVGLVAFIILATRFMMRRSAMPVVGSPRYGPAAPMQPYGTGGMGPMYPMGGGMGGGVGSGILGGLATGAAVGAGMVAGEELMHHVLDGNSGGSPGVVPMANADDFMPSQDDMGGQDFGIGGGSWDDGSSLGGDDWN